MFFRIIRNINNTIQTLREIAPRTQMYPHPLFPPRLSTMLLRRYRQSEDTVMVTMLLWRRCYCDPDTVVVTIFAVTLLLRKLYYCGADMDVVTILLWIRYYCGDVTVAVMMFWWRFCRDDYLVVLTTDTVVMAILLWWRYCCDANSCGNATVVVQMI